MNQLLLGILNKFVIPQAIYSAPRVSEVDPCRKNQKADEDILLGASLHRYLTEISDKLEGTKAEGETARPVCSSLCLSHIPPQG